MPENEYVRKILFDPLGMKETEYLPGAALLPRIAPTEMQKDGKILRGVVHDPTARYMGGVAGHAGVFSTADDLARFCQMILDGGDGLFQSGDDTEVQYDCFAGRADGSEGVGMGYPVALFSGAGRIIFPRERHSGHTGFTGTSIWIDPASQTYVVLLTNSVHPHQRKPITPLRGRVATIVAAAVSYDPGSFSGDGDWPRCAGKGKLSGSARQKGRADHQSNGGRPAGAAQCWT